MPCEGKKKVRVSAAEIIFIGGRAGNRAVSPAGLTSSIKEGGEAMILMGGGSDENREGKEERRGAKREKSGASLSKKGKEESKLQKGGREKSSKCLKKEKKETTQN